VAGCAGAVVHEMVTVRAAAAYALLCCCCCCCIGGVAATPIAAAFVRIVRLPVSSSSSARFEAAFEANATRGRRLTRRQAAAATAAARNKHRPRRRPGDTTTASNSSSARNAGMVAEFEPMDGVLIRYPLGIPLELIVDFSEHFNVYVLVSPALEIEARDVSARNDATVS
jgi:hypothetical protein